ncbi:hypothetical protein AMQ83_04195 [Paenibacillus riograndensis]|nr:hypothetical protein AMQ83_04195 [Paenibacillus riograndensis]
MTAADISIEILPLVYVDHMQDSVFQNRIKGWKRLCRDLAQAPEMEKIQAVTNGGLFFGLLWQNYLL